MSAPRALRVEGDERQRLKIRLARLEADVAYFQARLEIVRNPATANQEAQRIAFKALCKTLTDRIVFENQRMRDLR